MTPTKKVGPFRGKVIAKGVNGAGEPIQREYHFDFDKTEDEIYDLFVDHYREATHGKVPRDKFEIQSAT